MQLQQQAAAQIKAEQYADALASVDQSRPSMYCMIQLTSGLTESALIAVLIQQPNNAINRELHNVLKEKLQLGTASYKYSLSFC